MSNKILSLAIPVFAVSSLWMAGCAQMTRHSNTLVFGTDTTIGMKVGQDASQTPGLEIGYNRKELAFVPVLANTENGRYLGPCPPNEVEDCHFRATTNGKDKDSYSTIASFGGKAKGDANNVKGSVTVAQYFATGIAAQQLALTGGANIVQAGGDTKAKAKAAEKVAEAQERANALRVAASIDKGKIVARTILGKGGAPVGEEQRSELADMMGQGCDVPANSTETVAEYIERIRNERPTCLNRLGVSVSD